DQRWHFVNFSEFKWVLGVDELIMNTGRWMVRWDSGK
ncbi:hypothetical protein TNCT_608181, partial [Trichonephila clavata]